MPTPSSRTAGRLSLAGIAATGATLAALAAQVLALTAERFQSTLNSDYLLAHAFTRELLVSPYPVSGWKFGSGSFAFPDYFLYLPLFAVFGDSGASYPAYAVLLWTGYWIAFAAMLRASAGITRTGALVASGIALNLLLGTRLLPGGYADRLWQLSLPSYHGGNLLTELFCLALIFGAVRSGTWTRRSFWTLVAIAALGIFSNALVLLHVLLPAGALFAGLARAHGRFGFTVEPALNRDRDDGEIRMTENSGPRHLRALRYLRSIFFPRPPGPGKSEALRVDISYFRAIVLALVLAVALRLALALADIFFFASLFKEWPLPWLMWERWLKFVADCRTELIPEFPVMWGVVFAGVAVGAGLAWRSRKTGGVAFFAPALVLLTLLAVVATPVVAIYWKDSGSFRYLLPTFVLPVWILVFATTGLSRPVRLALATAGVVVSVVFGLRAVPEIRREVLEFPRPPGATALRDYLRAHGLRSGLCHFWEGHWLQNAWRYDGPALAHVRDRDFCEFWCNNAFGYFPESGGRFAAPEFDFILLNHLDPVVLRERLGGEIHPVKVGPYAVVKLTPEQSRRASVLVERQALDFLAGRRAARVRNDLIAPESAP